MADQMQKLEAQLAAVSTEQELINILNALVLEIKTPGQTYSSPSETEGALIFLQQVLSLATKIGSKPALYRCHQLLAQVFERQRDSGQALVHFKQLHQLYKEIELEKEAAERSLAEAKTRHHAAELMALVEVSQEISATLDLPTVLEQIASRTHKLLRATDTVVYLLQPDEGVLQAIAAMGDYADEMRLNTLTLGQGIIGCVAQNGVGEIINKPSLDARRGHIAGSWDKELGSDDDLFPMLVAPITLRKRVMGVIAIWRHVSAGLFAPANLNFLEALAQQAAIAIENIRLFEAEQRQRQLAESLREVAFVLSGSLDQATVVAKILEQLGRVIKHDGSALFLQEDQDLVLVAGSSINPSLIGSHIPLSYQRPAVHVFQPIQVFQEKKVVIVADVQADAGWEVWSNAYPIRTWMGAPLLVGEKAIGILTADNFAPNAYTPTDGQNLQTFANHAAVAIENARLFEAKEKANHELALRAHEITIFNDAIQMMTRTTNLTNALEVVARITVNFLEARNCGIALLNEAKTELEVVASVSTDSNYPSTVGTKIPVTDNPSSQHVLETRRSLVVTQAQQHTLTASIHALMRQLNTHCLMIVPLLARGEVIGTIGVDTSQPDREFIPPEVRFVETMAGQIAGAVGIARLFEAEQQHSRELETVNASLQATNADLDAFARMVAHDLKNPLGVLISYGDLLVGYGLQAPPHELQLIFQELHRAGQKAFNIVEELLLLARVRHKDSVRLESLDMAQIVEEAQQRLTFIIADHRAEIFYPASWPVAVGYAPWVEEIWANYLSNGLKYGGKPPRLHLGATLEQNGMIRFWVRDNGPGLPAEAQARLFAEFTRLNEVRAQGHGLGLSIVRRIVDRLGGQAGVESDNVPGQGCTFYFTLPADSQEN